MIARISLPKILVLNGAWLERKQESILSAALIITVANIVSSLFGLLRDRVLITYFFDTLPMRQSLEAFQLAFQIPDTLFQLIVLGALSAAFIPIFAKLKKQDTASAFQLSSIVMNVLLGVFLVASVIVFIWAEPLTIWRTGPGFTPSQIAIAVKLTRIMLLAQMCFAVSNILSGILQSFQRFILPAITPVVYNLAIILGVIAFSHQFGIYSAGIGVVIGAFLHMLIQVPLAYKLGFRFTLSFNLKFPGVKDLFMLMPPRFLTYGLTQLQDLSLGFFATSLGNLSFLILTLGIRLMAIPIRLFGVPIGQASLAFLAEEAEDATHRFKTLLIQSMNQVSFLALPASVLLLILRVPIVRLVFGAHNLPWETTLATGRVVAILALSVAAQAMTQLLIRGFHALKDTATPLLITSLVTSFYVFLCSAVIYLTDLGILGLAIVIGLTGLIEAVLLLVLLNHKVAGLLTKDLLIPQAKILLCGFLMAIFLYLPFRILDELVFHTSKTIELVGLTLTTATIGSLVYLYFALLLDVKELNLVSKAISTAKAWPQSLLKAPEVVSASPTQSGGLSGD